MTHSDDLPADSWLRKLAPGDKVWWTDPDSNGSSGYYTIGYIYDEEGIQSGTTTVHLGNEAGSEADAYARELAQVSPWQTIRLTIDVEYAGKDEESNAMRAHLAGICERALCDHLSDGQTKVLKRFAIKTTLPPQPLSANEVADFMRKRIEDSALHLDDIPDALARYGLMQPDNFIEEMRERMSS